MQLPVRAMPRVALVLVAMVVEAAEQVVRLRSLTAGLVR